jgi:hypothetical protein
MCAEICHAGHDLGEERFSAFFCDCGVRGSTSCRALPTKPTNTRQASIAAAAADVNNGNNGSAANMEEQFSSLQQMSSNLFR